MNFGEKLIAITISACTVVVIYVIGDKIMNDVSEYENSFICKDGVLFHKVRNTDIYEIYSKQCFEKK